MSRFSQSEETMIVKNAMELTATIIIEEAELKKINAEQFRSLPNPPQRKVLNKPNVLPQYPKPPQLKYTYPDFVKDIMNEYIKTHKNILIILVAIMVLLSIFRGFFEVYSLVICFAWLGLIFSIKPYQKRKERLNQEITQAPEYLQAIEDAEMTAKKEQEKLEEETRQKQEKLDTEYEKQKEKYESVIIPEYNDALSKWNIIKEKKVAFLEEELKYNNEALNNLYNTSKLISARYRDLAILQFLYEDMSTSDHDIRYATEILDRDRQRVVTENAGLRTSRAVESMNNTMKQGFQAVYDAIEYGNSLQEDTIEMLDKTRRDNNIANIIGTVQRHNTNKMLKSLSDKNQ